MDSFQHIDQSYSSITQQQVLRHVTAICYGMARHPVQHVATTTTPHLRVVRISLLGLLHELHRPVEVSASLDGRRKNKTKRQTRVMFLM